MVDQTFTVHPARREDIEPLTGLLQELFQIEADFTPNPARQRAVLRQLLDDSRSVVLVAEDCGEIVGMCTVQMTFSTVEGGPAGLVEDVVVTRHARRQRVGRTLLSAAESWALGRGLTRLQLLVESNNEAALAFYKEMGWQSTDLICRRKALP